MIDALIIGQTLITINHCFHRKAMRGLPELALRSVPAYLIDSELTSNELLKGGPSS